MSTEDQNSSKQPLSITKTVLYRLTIHGKEISLTRNELEQILNECKAILYNEQKTPPPSSPRGKRRKRHLRQRRADAAGIYMNKVMQNKPFVDYCTEKIKAVLEAMRPGDVIPSLTALAQRAGIKYTGDSYYATQIVLAKLLQEERFKDIVVTKVTTGVRGRRTRIMRIKAPEIEEPVQKAVPLQAEATTTAAPTTPTAVVITVLPKKDTVDRYMMKIKAVLEAMRPGDVIPSLAALAQRAGIGTAGSSYHIMRVALTKLLQEDNRFKIITGKMADGRTGRNAIMRLPEEAQHVEAPTVGAST